MDTKQKLSLLLERDKNKNKIGRLETANHYTDQNHLQRRQQQRAINEAMIKIALLYGQKEFSYGARYFTLNDRCLRNTLYVQFTDVLRGLRVVCCGGSANPQILTVYWHTETKNKVRK